MPRPRFHKDIRRSIPHAAGTSLKAGHGANLRPTRFASLRQGGRTDPLAGDRA